MKTAFTVTIIGLGLLSACSGRQWYTGMQASKRVECMRLPVSEQAACLEAMDRDYDEYQALRRPGAKTTGR